MPKSHKINHTRKNVVWCHPEITYDSWLKISTYAKHEGIDFPTAIERLADLINNPAFPGLSVPPNFH